MSPFVEWNELLLVHFFPPSAKDEEVWLQASRVELDSIGLRLGGVEGLVAAVQAGPPWLASYQNIADAAVRLVRQRNAGKRSAEYLDPGDVDGTYIGFSAPTYLPYLALWVLASAEPGGGFYAAVERMSNRPFASSNQVRSDMDAVWYDLEQWTRECGGEFGKFVVRTLGGYSYVGIPRSQCLISSKDKRGLPQLFWECRLSPRQDFSDQMYSQVASIAAHAYYLSNGLREAFTNSDYSEPLKHMLTAAFQSWDGKAPRALGSTSAGQRQCVDSIEDESLEVALVLRPAKSADVDWEIHWRIPAFLDAERYDLTTGHGTWNAKIEELGTHASTISATCQNEARQLIAGSSSSDAEFKVTFVEGEGENGNVARKVILPQRAVRTLVWNGPDPAFADALVEGEVPLTGPCYLLFNKETMGRNLDALLGSSRAKWEPFDSTGLPEGWGLGCIHHCDLLSTRERQEIVEDPVGIQEAARIRLVGGRPLVRGGGKTYAFYDLPIVELDAPDEAVLEAGGLELTKLGGDLPPEGDRLQERSRRSLLVPVASGIRRYALRIEDVRKALFEIRVVLEGNTIAATVLKVSVAGGLRTAQGRNFGLGPLGQVSPTGDRLLGVIRDVDGSVILGHHPARLFVIGNGSWKELEGSGDLDRITGSVPAKFLDSLALLGSIAYGTARDQILRLARQDKIDVQPPLLLLELRGRGYLEIETNDEGHMVRVHAVPPTLYTMPLQHDGRVVRGVCGTLQLQHWKDLGDCLGGLARINEATHSILPSLWLVPKSENDCREFMEEADFSDAPMPSSAIAGWAGGIADVRSTLGAWEWTNLNSNFRYFQKFNPNSAVFVDHEPPSLDIDPQVMASLFRFEDPNIQGLQTYLFGVAMPDGKRRFSYLQDSRWGIWLALGAFAEFARRVLGFDDVVPWPVHYSRNDGTLWLPARLRPPFVIERALLLCSASAPTPINSIPDRASPVYMGMAEGTWLAYPWVPEDIARKVAGLLGGALAILS